MERTEDKNNFLKLLADSFSKSNNFNNILEDYEEIAVSLILVHNVCYHYANIKEIDERHQAAIQQLWFTIEAIVNEGIKASEKKQ
jgi:hypothetical protein